MSDQDAGRACAPAASCSPRLRRRARQAPDEIHHSITRDGWRIALHRYRPDEGAHGAPVVLCHGMGSNRFNLDGPGEMSLARYLHRRGFDVWLLELRGSGLSRRQWRVPPVAWRWTFEDYVQHDAPAALRAVKAATGAARVLWVGHSLGGMVAYGVLMTPAGESIAAAVTIASPGMTEVGHERIDRWVALRRLLRFAPPMLPTKVLARLGAPLAGPLASLARGPIEELGWREENLDLEMLRFMMRNGVENLSRSLLIEFARWYETKQMSDRYGLFHFHDHLERIRAPMLILAGGRDGLTPASDIEQVFAGLGSPDKHLVVAGRETGFAVDYSHVDLVLSRNAPIEIYPVVGDWLEAHRSEVAREPR